jgi:transketolase
MLSESELKYLEDKARDIRISIIEMLTLAGSGHTAGPLGMADVFTVLYGKVLKHDPQKPDWIDRDRLVLSNGHIAPVLYSTMAHFGYFPVSELKTLRKFGSRLQGHPHREYLPGVETSSGPLGCGLSQTIGMALADRIGRPPGVNASGGDPRGSGLFFYCLGSDGEHNEGNVWEAILLAGKEKLGNVIYLIDRNNIQIDGFTEDIMPLEPFDEKYKAFNWDVQVVNGNNIREVYDAIEKAKTTFNKPSVIICKTTPGKGVKEFEFDFHWHGKAPNKEEAEKALKQLRNLGGHIEGHHN